MFRSGVFIFLFITASLADPKTQTHQENLAKLRTFGPQNGYSDYPLSTSSVDRYYAFKNLDNYNTQQAYNIDYSALSFVGVVCFSCKAKDMPPREHALCKKEFAALYLHVFGIRPDLTNMKLQATTKKEATQVSENKQVRSRLREHFRCKNGAHSGYEYTLFSTPN